MITVQMYLHYTVSNSLPLVKESFLPGKKTGNVNSRYRIQVFLSE